MTIRYGIRWDGRGRPGPAARLAILGTALIALCLPAAARAGDVDPVLSGSMQRIAGGTGLAGPDGSGVDVAIIDSGVTPVGSLAEPGRVVHGPDFSSERGDRQLASLDTFGHGTHLAGLIAGHDPITGFAGAAPGARVVSVKVAGSDGITTLGEVLSAIDWVRRNHDRNGLDIRVVNLSLGVEGGDYRSDVLAYAVEQLWREGIVVVAAAGNGGLSGRHVLDMPADDPYVIAAGATDTKGTAGPGDDRVADFSSRSHRRPPDVVAPGTEMVSLRVPGSTLDLEFPGARAVGDAFFRGAGTSQAAAVTSGLAARLLSRHPWLSPDQVKAMLVRGAVDLPDPPDADGAGRADLGRSLAQGVPSASSVRQTWVPAWLDTRALQRESGDRDDDDDEEWDDDGRRHSDDDDRRRGGDDDRDDDDDRDRDEDRDGDDGDRGRHAGAVNAEWSGRRWSGRRWSGRRWSGRRWSGASWIDGSGA